MASATSYPLAEGTTASAAPAPTAPVPAAVADDLYLFTYDQVAERLGVGFDTVRRMVERGELRAIRVGGRAIRISVTELRSYLYGGAA